MTHLTTMATPTDSGESKRTVMVAIDGSKQAEQAFDCKFTFVNITLKSQLLGFENGNGFGK